MGSSTKSKTIESSKKKIALEVRNVSKSFRLPTEQASGIKQAFINRVRGIKGYKEQHVLKDISFTVEKGDFFGIVGRNGSGKSTLLKLISQIYTPDKGKITVNGKLVPFIELGVGFNPELTGRENVYLNGALLGFSHEDMSAMYEDIVKFAELEEFMDQKLKNYSSGMQVRLAFSIAIKADADILVLDEVLAVGDESFQRKCFQYFAQLKREKKTVVLVTHDMDSVQRFCNRAMLIEKGDIVEIGESSVVAQKYTKLNNPDTTSIVDESDEGAGSKYVSGDVEYSVDEKNNRLIFIVRLKQKQSLDDPVVAFVINDEIGRQVYRWTTDEKIDHEINLEKDNIINLSLDNIFPVGTFSVSIRIMKRDRSLDYASLFNIIKFEIKNNTGHRWDVHWHPEEEYYIKGDILETK